MPTIGKVDLVLWGDEIRKAGVLLARARKMREALGGNPTDAEKEKSLALNQEAYAACEVALFGVEQDSAIVMVGSEPPRRSAA
jgi:hypothetical protein